MTATDTATECYPVSPSTVRVRRHRECRRERMRLLTVDLPEPVIEEASARGLLAPEERAKPWTVIQACYAAQLSDTALEWLIRKEILTREQRGDAVAILRSISDWLQRAGS